MSEPFGQVRTEVPAQGEGGSPVTVISAGREVEQGARSMLVLAEGLFRLDVVPQDDMVQTVIRTSRSRPAPSCGSTPSVASPACSAAGTR